MYVMQPLGKLPPAPSPLRKPRNDFEQWLHLSRWPHEELAAELGVTRQAVHRWKTGRGAPRGQEMREKIAILSGGHVPASCWDKRTRSPRRAA